MHIFRTAVIAATLAMSALRAGANDSTAALGAGGLELIRNDVVEILSEDLYVSADEIRVTYRFRNKTSAAATFLVAFPLPPVDAIVPEAANFVLPNAADPNFVDFRVSVDGNAITPSISERATVFGVDMSDVLRRHGLPLNPIADRLYETMTALPPATRDELNRLGLVIVDPYATQPAWRLETTFYWEQTFPPGQKILVEHRYRPVVGYAFFGDSLLDEPTHIATYCFDQSFANAARKKLAALADKPNPYLDEKRVTYVLTTANNWAAPIGRFRLVVDKGNPDALVSFCGTGVRKISPTQFEMTATDFVPDRELEILFALVPPAN